MREGAGWGPWVSVSVPVCGVELRPEVLKCMSASAGSGLVRTTTTAAAVVLKRTAPERLAAAVATPTPRRRGPAAPARRHLGPGGGAPAAASPARAPGRCGAGPGARRQSRRVYTPDGGFSPIPFSTSSIRSSSITTAQGESASAAWSRGAAARVGPASSRPAQIYSAGYVPATPLENLYPPHPNSSADPTCYQTWDPNLLPVWEHPSSKDSQCEPSRHLSLPPSKLIKNLSLRQRPLLKLGSDETATWCVTLSST